MTERERPQDAPSRDVRADTSNDPGRGGPPAADDDGGRDVRADTSNDPGRGVPASEGDEDVPNTPNH